LPCWVLPPFPDAAPPDCSGSSFPLLCERVGGAERFLVIVVVFLKAASGLFPRLSTRLPPRHLALPLYRSNRWLPPGPFLILPQFLVFLHPPRRLQFPLTLSSPGAIFFFGGSCLSAPVYIFTQDFFPFFSRTPWPPPLFNPSFYISVTAHNYPVTFFPSRALNLRFPYNPWFSLILWGLGITVLTFLPQTKPPRLNGSPPRVTRLT